MRKIWATRYVPAADEIDEWDPHGVVGDAAGNVYVAAHVRTKKYDVDYLTLKYDARGRLLWRQRYDGPEHDVDRARDIAVDGQGNVYVTGDSDKGTGKVPSRLAGLDIATIKYSPSGKQLWVRRYNGPDDGEDRPIQLLLDSSGCLYILGWSRSMRHGIDMALIKYRADGSLEWADNYDGEEHGDDNPVCMARDRSGNIYVAATSISRHPAGPRLDYLTIKYTPGGRRAWLRRWGTASQWDNYAKAIGLDASGNIYVTGEARVTGTADAHNSGCVILKYSPSGDLKWARGTTSESDRLTFMTPACVSPEGNIVVVGRTNTGSRYGVWRTVMRDSSGIARWADSSADLGFGDGPGRAILTSNGIYECGTKHVGSRRFHILLKYDYSGHLAGSYMVQSGYWPSGTIAPMPGMNAGIAAAYRLIKNKRIELFIVRIGP